MKEKQQLCQLNDRFASYVERVRFLEAQNKKLEMELSILSKKWGVEGEQIKQMYQIELDEARAVLKETNKGRIAFQVKAGKSELEMDAFKQRCHINPSSNFLII